MLADPRAEPQYGERVPYVVITGAPGARLIDRCVSPETLLQNDHLELDADYYINKNLIPPLERIFNLVGANVRQWYDEMPKVQRIRNITMPITRKDETGTALGNTSLKKTLESYMRSSNCILCRAKLTPPPSLPDTEPSAYAMLPLCEKCLKKPAHTLLALRYKIWHSENYAREIDRVCRECSGLAFGDEIRCDSRDCPVFYSRIKERSRLANMKESVEPVLDVLQEKEDVVHQRKGVWRSGDLAW
jgi:DNA polymerase zeta